MVSDISVFNGANAAVLQTSAPIDAGRFKLVTIYARGHGASVDASVTLQLSNSENPMVDLDWTQDADVTLAVSNGSEMSDPITSCYRWWRILSTPGGSSVGTIDVILHAQIYNSGGMI